MSGIIDNFWISQWPKLYHLPVDWMKHVIVEWPKVDQAIYVCCPLFIYSFLRTNSNSDRSRIGCLFTLRSTLWTVIWSLMVMIISFLAQTSLPYHVKIHWESLNVTKVNDLSVICDRINHVLSKRTCWVIFDHFFSDERCLVLKRKV